MTGQLATTKLEDSCVGSLRVVADAHRTLVEEVQKG